MSTAQSWKVGEPRGAKGRDAVVCLEVAAYPEAKILSPSQLATLVRRLGDTTRVAAFIGASEAFVRQNMRWE